MVDCAPKYHPKVQYFEYLIHQKYDSRRQTEKKIEVCVGVIGESNKE